MSIQLPYEYYNIIFKYEIKQKFYYNWILKNVLYLNVDYIVHTEITKTSNTSNKYLNIEYIEITVPKFRFIDIFGIPT